MLDSNGDQRQFKYRASTEFSMFLLAIFSFLYVAASLLAVFDLLRHLLNPTGLTFSILINDVVIGIGGVIWFIINWSLIYSSPAIEIEEWGLRLKSFPLKTFEVKWSDIAYIRQARWKPILQKRRDSVVVMKNGLTRFHCICGVFYAGTTKPSFLISLPISNHDELLKIVSDNIKKSRRAER